ncbi:MAG: type III pantothenate kinase [Sphaerochaetaceae bacterium]|jgi:type III pantothenate kinase|nr:type III pantothenate kinase [Sphaerochaetaceae bacterium]NLO61274.1 type III pantothenate kinase [Spirochaetales bacterium]MDD2406884.1 type III pantothenate kinase [Sphaerochaetaceae bacterium]MDD3669831.1 type III pantothenate kinase [Sphaerochaetaceae bacterium]MDD4259078.1 type III pantothenate kinase [Sphaerochaetaceae bacterium]
MLLVMDIGNTNVVIAVHDGTDWVGNWRIYSDAKKTSDEYFVIVEHLLENSTFKGTDITEAIVSSVVPNLTRAFQKVIKQLAGFDPVMVTHDICPGIKRETIPPELGYDMLANAVAGHNMYPNDNVAILDFGTALTITVVSSSGDLLGASIAPGLVTAVNSLFHNTAQIPQVQLKVPEKAIGRDSDESIRSGIMYGYAGLVKELIAKMEEELSQSLKVIATGGLSATIAPLIGRIDKLSPLHTLEGLRLMVSSG